MGPRPPRNFNIQISLDDKLNFHYEDLFTKDDASSIKLIKDDRIAWTLHPSIQERELQIDFGPINPFTYGEILTMRGLGQVVTPAVYFPPDYHGNHTLKYKVSIGCGFSDDPDVVPVENPNGLNPTLLQNADLEIDWVSASHEAITLNDLNVQKSAAGAKALIIVRWKANAKPATAFSLLFTSPPAGWPKPVAQSTVAKPAITFELPPGAKTKYTIRTTADNGDEIEVSGYLTVTA